MKKICLLVSTVLIITLTFLAAEAIPDVKGNYYLSFCTAFSNPYNETGVRMEYGIKKCFTLSLKFAMLQSSEPARIINGDPVLVINPLPEKNSIKYAIEGTRYFPLFAQKRLDFFVMAGLEYVDIHKVGLESIHWDWDISPAELQLHNNFIQVNLATGLRYWLFQRLAMGCSLSFFQYIWRNSIISNSGWTYSLQATMRL